MNQTQQLKRQRLIIDALGASAFIAITTLALSFTLAPFLNQRQEIDGRLAQLQLQQTQVSQAQQTLAAKQQLVNQLTESHYNQALKLQPAQAINHHIDDLTRLINRSGLEVHSVQPGKTINHNRYNVVPIVIAGQGEYPNYSALLNQINAAFPDTAVQQWELKNTLNNPSQQPTYQLQLAWHTQP